MALKVKPITESYQLGKMKNVGAFGSNNLPFRQSTGLAPYAAGFLNLFANGEVGAVVEPYNPTSLVTRVNLVDYSQQFTKWLGGTTGVIVTDNVAATTAPDGTFTASKIVESATNDFHRFGPPTSAIYGSLPTNLGSDKARRFSIFAKAAERTTARGWSWAGGDSSQQNFDLISGIPNGSNNPRMKYYGNGWWRCSFDIPVINTAGGIVFGPNNGGTLTNTYVGDGVSGIYVWGGQYEYGTVETDYQPTTDWYSEYNAAALLSIGLWQDAVGSTPVTAYEQPVALILDSRFALQRGMPLPAPTPVLTAGAGTAVNNNDGTFTLTGGGNVRFNYPLSALINGMMYESEVEILSATTGSNTIDWCDGFTNTIVAGSRGKKYTKDRRAAYDATFRFLDVASTAGSSITFRLNNTKPIPGNHSVQATTTSRGILSARYNLMVKTEEMDDPAWNRNNVSVSVNASVDPNGNLTADGLAAIANAINTFYSQFSGNAISTSYKLRRYVKAVTVTSMSLTIWDNTVSTHKVTSARIISGPGAIAVNASNYADITGLSTTAWTLVEIATTVMVIGNQLYEIGYVRDGTGGANIIAGDSIAVWGVDLRTANDWNLNLPAYQRVNVPYDYDTVGFPPYIQTDGVDDSYETGSIDLSSYSKVSIWAGITKQSDATTAILAEFNSGVDGSFSIYAPPNAGLARFGLATRGLVSAGFQANLNNDQVAPVSRVLSALFDNNQPTSSTQVIARQDGGIPAGGWTNDSVAATTAANYGNAKFYTARRTGSTLPFKGRIYFLMFRAALDTCDMTLFRNVEQYIAQKMGKSFVST